MQTPFICPSILAADFARLGEEVSSVVDAGADMIHFDVMDNHYVPNLSVGPVVCAALRAHGISAPIDVHLMVQPIERMIEDFAQAGANVITIHADATTHLDRSLAMIRDKGCLAGLAFNPASSLDALRYVMDKIDMILVMSVNPGFGGQSFIDSALNKLRDARALIDDSGHSIRLQVDGGVKVDNIAQIAAAGADTFVAGSAIFAAGDYAQTIAAMRGQITNQGV